MVKNKNSSFTPKRALIISTFLAVVLISVGFAVKYFYLERYILAAKSAEIVSIRELIISAAQGTKTDAPIDPKTGDVYFPQAKLFIPNVPSSAGLTYAYYEDEELGEDISVSSRPVFHQKIVPLYAAMDINQIFAAVPALQACQRGITLSYHELTGREELLLEHTAHLNNGKSLFMYGDRGCSEHTDTVEILKGIQAY